MTSRFLLDPANGKMMGVCSGFARWANVDPTLVRVAAVLVGLCAGPVAAIAYLATGLVAERG